MEYVCVEEGGVGKPVIGEDVKEMEGSESGSGGKMESRNCAWLERRVSKFSSTSGWAGTSKSMVKVLEGAVGVDGESWGPSRTLWMVNIKILRYQIRIESHIRVRRRRVRGPVREMHSRFESRHLGQWLALEDQ